MSGGEAQIQTRVSETTHYNADDLLRQINERISQAAQMDCLSRDW